MSDDTAMVPRRIDVGRALVPPVMALLGVSNTVAVWRHVVEPQSSGAMQVAIVGRSLLLVGFYALLVAFYLLRTAARSTTASLAARAGAVVATFLPFALAPLTTPVDSLLVLSISNVLMLAGLAWSVWSLLHLGRSVSIVAQARSLVRSGPYGVVRHPLYLGEIVTVFGLVIGGFTWLAFVLLTALVSLQLYRASREEEVLEAAFPEYAQYRLQTPRRVIPAMPTRRVRRRQAALSAADGRV